MSLVILIAIIAIAVLLVWAIDNIPGLPSPWVFKLVILLIAAIVIANRAGFI